MSDEQQPQDEEPSSEPAGADEKAEAAPEGGEAPAADPEAVVEEMRERLLRALADAENTRRRAERDREDALKYAITRFARDILAVADNLRRALGSVDDAAKAEGGAALEALLSGVEVTERELMNIFARHGIVQVDPQPGEKFDPNLHQAMAEVPGTGQPSGTVVQVTQTGFVIGDRLLRPAMVLVAKDAGAKDANGAAEPAEGAES